jgi:hypothetical protein
MYMASETLLRLALPSQLSIEEVCKKVKQKTFNERDLSDFPKITSVFVYPEDLSDLIGKVWHDLKTDSVILTWFVQTQISDYEHYAALCVGNFSIQQVSIQQLSVEE